MSGKKLLAENTIRRFMRLANVEPLTSNFIAENYGEEEIEEEQISEELGEAPEVDMEEEPEIDMEEEPEIDMEEEPTMEAADMSLTEEEAQLLVSLGERLSVALESAPEGGDEMPEPEDEVPAEDDLGAIDDIPVDDEEEVAPAMRYENQEALVREVLKRVTKRVVSARKARK